MRELLNCHEHDVFNIREVSSADDKVEREYKRVFLSSFGENGGYKRFVNLKVGVTWCNSFEEFCYGRYKITPISVRQRARALDFLQIADFIDIKTYNKPNTDIPNTIQIIKKFDGYSLPQLYVLIYIVDNVDFYSVKSGKKVLSMDVAKQLTNRAIRGELNGDGIRTEINTMKGHNQEEPSELNKTNYVGSYDHATIDDKGQAVYECLICSSCGKSGHPRTRNALSSHMRVFHNKIYRAYRELVCYTKPIIDRKHTKRKPMKTSDADVLKQAQIELAQEGLVVNKPINSSPIIVQAQKAVNFCPSCGCKLSNIEGAKVNFCPSCGCNIAKLVLAV